MKIYLNEITDLETQLDFTQDEQWVLDAVTRVDEKTEESFHPKKKRPVSVSLSLRNVDTVIVVSGKIDTFIELVCSRCAALFQRPCKTNFSGLFCKDPVMAGIAHLHRQGSDPREAGQPMGQNKGFARHAHNFANDSEEAQEKDLDITYLSHDIIDLAEVVTEQLQLQVPFQPLCKEDCKGMCSQCGTDLNLGRCACSKIKSSHPFSVLSDYKI